MDVIGIKLTIYMHTVMDQLTVIVKGVISWYISPASSRSYFIPFINVSWAITVYPIIIIHKAEMRLRLG